MPFLIKKLCLKRNNQNRNISTAVYFSFSQTKNVPDWFRWEGTEIISLICTCSSIKHEKRGLIITHQFIFLGKSVFLCVSCGYAVCSVDIKPVKHLRGPVIYCCVCFTKSAEIIMSVCL